MEDLLAYGVELCLTQHGLLFLALDVELYDVGVRGVDQGFDLAGVYREGVDLGGGRIIKKREGLGLAVAAQYAGDHALAANRLGGLLAEISAFYGLD